MVRTVAVLALLRRLLMAVWHNGGRLLWLRWLMIVLMLLLLLLLLVVR